MEKMNMKADYRIKKADGKILNAGTDKGSWMHIEEARKLVNRDEGEIIIYRDFPGEVF